MDGPNLEPVRGQLTESARAGRPISAPKEGGLRFGDARMGSHCLRWREGVGILFTMT